jgi:two-component system cell cycle sensor histidine kinase/response regulator CckA
MEGCEKLAGKETILLVEDEVLVCDVTKRILERGGYTVLIATNGREALNLYLKKMDVISLVILDLIMPEMGGKECLRKLRENDPNVKTLVISGHCKDGIAKEVIESGAIGFVCKPYDSKQILTAVRRVLDSD